jgi:nudix-type nucleoside diphosphatase (YffH/AdpP family)
MTIAIARVDTIHQGYSRFLIATLRFPDGQTMRREIEDHGNAVAVLPYDPERRTAILVRQFRAPVYLSGDAQELLEAVAGGLEASDADPGACALREAHEEAGLDLKTLEHVATAWPMPGISTERMSFYLATYREQDRVGMGGGVPAERENITVIELSLDELAAKADRAELTDVKALLLTQTLRLRRPELFRR